MSNTNPGFSGFMGNFMPGASNSHPPPAMATQTARSQSERTAVPTNRPDLMHARQPEDGINIQDQFSAYNDKKESTTRSINTSSPPRPEMKGPTDISDLLSGLKTMSVSMPSPSAQASAPIKIPQPKSTSANKPRKQKSDKNTVSLDI
jgi:hypothetical protein